MRQRIYVRLKNAPLVSCVPNRERRGHPRCETLKYFRD